MTELQKKIFLCLFRGGHIVKQIPGKDKPQITMFDIEPTIKSPDKYSVREKDFKLVHRIGVKSIPFIFDYCREVRRFKTTVYEINKKKVLSLNGNSWIKKEYKKIRDEIFIQNAAAKLGQFLNSFPKKVAYLCPPCTLQIITSTYKSN
jgi:hypothetical protein